MMPPNCCLCEKGMDTGHPCELIAFKRTAEDENWHRAMQQEAADASRHLHEKAPPLPTSHPPETDWFCADHTTTARAHQSRTITEALNVIRTQEIWHLIYIDLFDRDTPPSASESGYGFELGLRTYIDHATSTINESGGTYPSEYRISLGNATPNFVVNAPDVFELNRLTPPLRRLKKLRSNSDFNSQSDTKLLSLFSDVLRAYGCSALHETIEALTDFIGDEASTSSFGRFLQNYG